MWQSVVASVISGVIMLFVGIFIGEPLKKWVNGQRKAEKMQESKTSDKKKIIDYLMGISSIPDTEDIRKALFPKKTIDEVYELLLELEDEGRVKRKQTYDNYGKDSSWLVLR